MRDLSHVLAFARTTPWAIRPDYAHAIMDVLSRRAAGVRLSDWEADELLKEKQDEVQARIAADAQASRAGVAIIPILGVLSARAGVMAQTSGMVSPESIAAQIAQAEADTNVTAILLDINSPGGSVHGIPELCARIRAATKPIVAHARYVAASAAYWVGSQADEFIASPSSELGSIGALMIHTDESKKLAEEGLALTFITAGRYKAEWNEATPLSDDARAMAQRKVDAAFGVMVKDIAIGRGVPPSMVRGEKFGEGRMFNADEAKTNGLVDRVEPFEETLAALLQGKRRMRTRGTRAEAVTEVIEIQSDDPVIRAFVPTETRIERPLPESHDAALASIDLDLA